MSQKTDKMPHLGDFVQLKEQREAVGMCGDIWPKPPKRGVFGEVTFKNGEIGWFEMKEIAWMRPLDYVKADPDFDVGFPLVDTLQTMKRSHPEVVLKTTPAPLTRSGSVSKIPTKTTSAVRGSATKPKAITPMPTTKRKRFPATETGEGRPEAVGMRKPMGSVCDLMAKFEGKSTPKSESQKKVVPLLQLSTSDLVTEDTDNDTDEDSDEESEDGSEETVEMLSPRIALTAESDEETEDFDEEKVEANEDEETDAASNGFKLVIWFYSVEPSPEKMQESVQLEESVQIQE